MSLATEIRAGRAFVEIVAKDASLAKGLQKAQLRLKTFVSEVRSLAADMEVALSFGSAVGDLTKNFAAFDDKLRVLQAVTQGSTDVLAKLKAQSLDLAKTTGFTADEIVSVQIELAKLGFTATEVLKATDPVLKMVRAVGAESFRLGEAAEMTAAILKDFNLPATETARICDIMAFAANKSAVDIFDLGQSMKTVGPLAYQVGDSLEDVVAQLMVLSNAGIKGELAGTALRRVYQSLAEQASPAAAQLREMGISVTDTNGDLRSAIDILSELSAVVNRMRSGEKINFTVDVFDIRGTLGALPLFSNNEEMQAYREELQSVAGTTEKAVRQIEGGIGGSLRRLAASLDAIKKAFGESFASIVKFFADLVAPLLAAVEPLLRLSSGFLSFAAVIGGALVALGTMTKTFSFLNDLFVAGKKTATAAGSAIKGVFVNEQRNAQLAQAATARAERVKALEQQKADAIRVASENRRHWVVLNNARAEEIELLGIERRKLKNVGNPQSSEADALRASIAKRQKNLTELGQQSAQALKATKAHIQVAKQAEQGILREGRAALSSGVNYGRASAAIAKMTGLKKINMLFSKRYSIALQKLSLQEIFAGKVGVGASKLRAAAYTAEIAVLKVLNKGLIALNKAFAALMKNPLVLAAAIAIGIIALGKSYRSHLKEQQKMSEDLARQQVEDAAEVTAARKAELEALISNIDKLKSFNKTLNSAEQQEALAVIADLTAAYGDLGISIDSATGKLVGFEQVQKKALQAASEGVLKGIEYQQKSLAQNLNVLFAGATGKRATLRDQLLPLRFMEKGARTKEIAGIRRLYSTEAFAEHFLDEDELPLQDALNLIDRFKEITDSMDNLVLDEAKAKLDVSKASVSSVNRVLRENGLTPESFTQQISELANSVGESFAEVTKGNEFQQKLNQTKKLQDDVNKNLGLYNKFAEAERTRLSETLEQLRKDREVEAAKDYANLRYVEMLDVEILKTETALNSLNKDFANFQTEMEKASVVAAEWSKEAEKIATESQQQFRDFWSSYNEKENQKDREEADSRYIEFAQKTGTLQTVFNETLNNLNKVNDDIYQKEAMYFANMANAFSSSGSGGSFVTDEESGRLNSLQRNLEMLIGERDYLENLADQIKQAAGGLQTSVLGSFSAAALDRMSGASISAEERTAKATEATAKGINRLHRDFGTLQDAYVLGY